jgi:predicted nucleotide-binding protein
MINDCLGHTKMTLSRENDAESRLEEKKLDFSPSTIETNVRNTGATAKDSVFLVHGQNEGVRESVARFLEHLDLHVIILHERPDRGRTIIQKFKDHSAEAAFAIVLLTADDRGGPKEQDPSSYQLRARQNVIFELGFFIRHSAPPLAFL